jgi:valyl-tRNA synthetase
MKIGRRLAIKLLNAAKFSLSFELPAGEHGVCEAVDLAMLAGLSKVIDQATEAFEKYDHTRALEVSETFFWNFTDDYMELVKERAYGLGGHTEAQRASAVLALREALGVMVRLFAPFIPFAAEEVWSWWQEGSVHQAAWPTSQELKGENPELLDLASSALVLIRKSKSDAKLSMKAEIDLMQLVGPTALQKLKADLKDVGKIRTLELIEGTELAVHSLTFSELPTAE